jgi:hypothetical protein
MHRVRIRGPEFGVNDYQDGADGVQVGARGPRPDSAWATSWIRRTDLAGTIVRRPGPRR